MCKRLLYLITFVLALGFVAGVATADPVVYELTTDEDPTFAGEQMISGYIIFDTDEAPDTSEDGIDTYIWSLNEGADTFNPAIVEASFNVAGLTENFSTSEAWKLVVELKMATSDDTPLTLLIDSDWGVDGGAPYLYTNEVLNFDTGEGAIDNPHGRAITGAALTPGEALIDLGEDPADGSTVGINHPELIWVLPEPNDPGGTVTCDVWFAIDDDYPEAGLPGDPNFALLYATQIVGDPVPVDVNSVTMPDLPLLKGHTYYWRIDTYDDSDNDQPVESKVFTFNTNNQAPIVEIVGDDAVWLTDGSVTVPLTGVVTDDDGPNPVSLEWAVIDEPNSVDDPAIISPAINVEDITVTATLIGTYELQLTADDGADTVVNTVTITVYEDSCEAAKGEGIEPLQSDFNEDCVTDLADFAEFAAEWLESIAL